MPIILSCGKKIKFGTSVEQCTRTEDGWNIIAKDVKTGNETNYTCDFLTICTGSNSVPKDISKIAPGFMREKIHSIQFQDATPYKDKTVIVIGAGESASDIAVDIGTIAKSCTVWSRRPFLLAPRFPEMINNDPNHDEYKIMQTDSLWSELKIADYLEYFNANRIHNLNPLWLWGALRQGFWDAVNQEGSKAAPAMKLLCAWCQFNWKAIDANPNLRKKAWLQADQAAFVTKNSRLCSACAKGIVDIIVAPNAEFSSDAVTFPQVLGENLDYFDQPQSRTIVNVDSVICCIGYETTCPFLDIDDLGICLDPRTWFKHCFPPNLGHKLAFIGWARPHQGGIPAAAELLARYHALIVAGKKDLPENYAQIGMDEGKAESEFYFLSPNLKSLVDYPSFADSVAKLIGCKPRMPMPFWSPSMFFKYWIYPMWPCWYRLRGPGANPQAANLVLKTRFPISRFGFTSINPVPTILTGIVSCFQTFVNTITFLFRGGTKGANIGKNYLWNRSKYFVLHGNSVFTLF